LGNFWRCQIGATAKISYARIVPKCLKSLVADAVICEPVSYDNSLLTGKFTGNLAISDRFGRDVIEKIAVPQ